MSMVEPATTAGGSTIPYPPPTVITALPLKFGLAASVTVSVCGPAVLNVTSISAIPFPSTKLTVAGSTACGSVDVGAAGPV